MIKYKIAQLLDDLFPQLCWANLVMWAEGITPFKEAFTQECRDSNAGTPYAYCNKCEITKRYYDVTRGKGDKY